MRSAMMCMAAYALVMGFFCRWADGHEAGAMLFRVLGCAWALAAMTSRNAEDRQIATNSAAERLNGCAWYALPDQVDTRVSGAHKAFGGVIALCTAATPLLLLWEPLLAVPIALSLWLGIRHGRRVGQVYLDAVNPKAWTHEPTAPQMPFDGHFGL